MSERNYAGATGPQRKAARRAALLDAALDLLTTDGPEAITVRRVCAHARLNDRYFYASFGDRDELLPAAWDVVTADALGALTVAIETTKPDPPSRVRAVIEAIVTFFAGDKRYARLLIESQTTEALRRRRHASVRQVADIVAEQGREMLGAAVPDPVDQTLAALTMVNGCLDLLVTWLRGEVEVTREHLVDFLVAMILTSSDITAALQRERRG
ncbi:TetR/AcrR family transcriptional regulator [Amycolatopsis sp. NPDC059027]|uniref:TetR/AcrR family transcriptional regulator n=1 Tax=unclassified Amycolatopsis TaxID=2618356 RepID=UPI0036723CE8